MAIYAYAPFTDEDEATIGCVDEVIGDSTLEEAYELYLFMCCQKIKDTTSYKDDYGFIHRVFNDRKDTLYMYLFEMDDYDVTKPLERVQEYIKECPPFDVYDQLKKLETMLEGHEFDIE